MRRSTSYYPLVMSALALTLVLLLSKVQAQPMGQPPEFQTVVTSQYGFDNTVAMLKGTIECRHGDMDIQ